MSGSTIIAGKDAVTFYDKLTQCWTVICCHQNLHRHFLVKFTSIISNLYKDALSLFDQIQFKCNYFAAKHVAGQELLFCGTWCIFHTDCFDFQKGN